MKTMLRSLMAGTSAFALSPEGGSGGDGGDAGAADGGAKTPESVLFPNENGGDGKGEGGEGDGSDPAGKKEGGDAGADWKEYVPDPKKTAEENAAAKVEHDKTKPKEDDGKGKNKDDDPANKVPEDGKYTLTMPEGVEVDQELLDALGPKFAAKKMTNAEAQELADEFIKVQTARETKKREEWGNTVQKWADDAKADKDIGGDKWDATVASSRRAVNALGTPALKEYLQASGGGNHPELIRVFAKVGELIKEDDPAGGGAEGKGKPAETAHVLFPNDVPKG